MANAADTGTKISERSISDLGRNSSLLPHGFVELLPAFRRHRRLESLHHLHHDLLLPWSDDRLQRDADDPGEHTADRAGNEPLHHDL